MMLGRYFCSAREVPLLAKLQALVGRNFHEQAGTTVALAIQDLKRYDHGAGAIVLGAHAVQRLVVDKMVV